MKRSISYNIKKSQDYNKHFSRNQINTFGDFANNLIGFFCIKYTLFAMLSLFLSLGIYFNIVVLLLLCVIIQSHQCLLNTPLVVFLYIRLSGAAEPINHKH